MSDELKKLLEQAHYGITTFDFEGKQIPCIILDEKKFDDILSKIAGKALAINTDLNILQDGLGHVFVEISLTFSQGGFVEKILVNANKDLPFFEALAENSMLSLSSPKSNYGKENVFMIQLPQREKAENALKTIQTALQENNQN